MNEVLDRLNTSWHRTALWLLMVMVLAHILEHAVQAVQIYALGWDVPDSRGLVGHWFPWLVTSEWMHYLYAILTLVGVALLLPGFVGRAWLLWAMALAAQFWHHFEHALLLTQRLTHTAWFGESTPVSLVQLVAPRVELHLFYNALVFTPMVIALAYHLFPTKEEATRAGCGCALLRTVRPGRRLARA